MITEIIYSHPSPSINIGGKGSKYSAEIKFDICIDSTEATYKSVSILGVSTSKWTLEDLAFIESTINVIKQIKNKPLKDILGISSYNSLKESKQ